MHLFSSPPNANHAVSSMPPKPPPVKRPRMKFSYDDIEPKPTTEPPRPTSVAAQNYTPNPYLNTKLTHEKIAEIRNKSSMKDVGELGVPMAGLILRLTGLRNPLCTPLPTLAFFAAVDVGGNY